MCISITDNGCGISEEHLHKIFEPFFTTKAVNEGTGLGLAMSFGAIQSHGGKIIVDSSVAQGTCMSIILPVVDVLSSPLLQVEQQELIGKGESILIVDDDQVVREMAFELLTTLNYRCLIASNGLEALKVLKDHQGEIDLVLLDVIMPKLGGRRTAEEIRKLDPDKHIIYMTGYDDGVLSGLPSNERYSVISKPFTVESLNAEIRGLLDRE